MNDGIVAGLRNGAGREVIELLFIAGFEYRKQVGGADVAAAIRVQANVVVNNW